MPIVVSFPESIVAELLLGIENPMLPPLRVLNRLAPVLERPCVSRPDYRGRPVPIFFLFSTLNLEPSMVSLFLNHQPLP